MVQRTKLKQKPPRRVLQCMSLVLASLRHHEAIRLCPLTRVKRSCGRHCRRTESDPEPDMDGLKFPQCGGVLAPIARG
jgi:hypothetical protein